MYRRLMRNFEIKLRQSIWPKGRRFIAACPYCFAIAMDHISALGKVEFPVYELKVPRLPNTATCPGCDKKVGYYVDSRTHAPKLGTCDKCELGIYQPANVDGYWVAAWKVLDRNQQASILALPRGVDLPVKCSECSNKQLVTVSPVRGKQIT